MGRYSKFNSSYILRKQHQNINNGEIIERDWVTIGERDNIRSGKKRVFGDGNFLFTENTESMAYRKGNVSKWVGSYTYDDVKDATDKVNAVKLNTTTNDPLVFAYYGSLYAKFEGAIVNVIKNFPGQIVFGNVEYKPILMDYQFPDNLSKLTNDFEIDFISTPRDLTDDVNELRYMPISWQNYVIVDGGVEKEIIGYRVVNTQNNLSEIENVYIGNAELFKYNGKFYKYDKSTGQYTYINIEEKDNYFVKCNEYIVHEDKYYKWSDDKLIYVELPIEKICEPNVYKMFEITFSTADKDYKIYIYKQYGYLVYVNEITDTQVQIKPKNEIIERYFSNLKDIEAIMLNRRSNPNYSFEMVLCESDEMNNISLNKVRISWPKNDDYCIQISGTDFNSFIDKVLTSAERYDENFSDNIWRNMTHESIKNYDWSYEKNGIENDNIENQIGSNIVSNVLRLIGMEFDEIKLYINGISASNKMTYDGFLNMPDSEVVNALELGGFDAFSTIWRQSEYVQINRDEVPENTIPNNYFTIPSADDVLDDYISVGCEESTSGISYYKRVNRIGDEVRLDQQFFYPEIENDVIVKNNPWIKENFSGYSYKKLFSPPNVLNSYWNDRNTFDYAPSIGTKFSPKYVRVTNGGGYVYYEKTDTFESEEYIHKKWFEKLDPNYFSQTVVDIDFMKRLGLSEKNIFATKGTAHAIDMIMGIFGFGRENDLQMSDYEIREPYNELSPIGYDDEFYYYEPLQNEPDNVVYTTNATFMLLPLNITDNDTTYPINIRVDDGDGGYYYFEKKHKKASEVVSQIMSNIIKTNYDVKEYPGFPLATTIIKGKKYIIPCVSDRYTYYGDIYFQTKGGWCKKSSLNSGIYDYSETVPYITSVNTVGNLLSYNLGEINVGDYVYVKYPLYQNDIFNINPTHISNYFKLVSNEIDSPESWRNVPLSGPIEFDNYVPITDDPLEPTHDDFVNVKFIDEIIFTNIGNNPHKGNGKYDGGVDYLSYMKMPFKYAVDNSQDFFANASALSLAKQFVFAMSTHRYDLKKLYVDSTEYVYEEMQNEPEVDIKYWNSSNTYTYIPSTIYQSSPRFIRIGNDNDGYTYFKLKSFSDETKKYFLNSKVVIMRNLLNSVNYKRYFNSIIKPYLTQIIPSTTIFVLENFNECEENSGIYYNIQTRVSGNTSCGTTTGDGRYFECDTAILSAKANDGCHFVRWALEDCETHEEIETEVDLSIETINVKVVGDACYRAIFEENCTVTFSNGRYVCDTLQYSDEPYGTILHNGIDTYSIGKTYRIDQDELPFYFSTKPNDGFEYEMWSVYDGNNDITEELEANNIISINETTGWLEILSIDELCGCSIRPIYKPIEYTISAEILCPCDGSSVEISQESLCDPVMVEFKCAPSTYCCDDIKFNVVIPGGTYTKFPNETLLIERGTNINVTLLNDSSCCEPNTLFYTVNGQRTNHGTIFNFNADSDCIIEGHCSTIPIELSYEFVCCDFTSFAPKFYYESDSLKTAIYSCYCGDKICLDCDYTCIKPNFSINGQTVSAIDNGTFMTLKIPAVSENVNVKINYNISDIEPVFRTPVLIDTPITGCFNSIFGKGCNDNCNVFTFSVEDIGDGCNCSCKYNFKIWQYKTLGGTWVDMTEINENGEIDSSDYLRFLTDLGCTNPEIRPSFVLKPVSVLIGSNIQQCIFTVNLHDSANDYDEILNPGDTYPNRMLHYAITDLILDLDITSECYELIGLDSIGDCKPTIEYLSDNRYRVSNLCGDVTLEYNFRQTNNFEVNIAIYDFETNQKTNSGCAKISCDAGEGTEITRIVHCGDSLEFDVNLTGFCCEEIQRIDIVTNNNITDVGRNPHQIIDNITENIEARVYIKHHEYTVYVRFLPSGSQCGGVQPVLPNGCLQINCIGEIKPNLYMCGSPVSFSKIKTCPENIDTCCLYDFDVIETNGYEFGFASNYNFQGNYWEEPDLVEIRSDLNQIFTDSITENMVLVVKYDCHNITDPSDGSVTIKPIDANTHDLLNDNNCLIYSVNQLSNDESCSKGYEIVAETNDCYKFVRWMLYDDNENAFQEYSRDLITELWVCKPTTVYAEFEIGNPTSNTIDCIMKVFEQNMGEFNKNMHDIEYYENLQYDRKIISGICGGMQKNKTVTFINEKPEYFSFQGIYYYDEFTHNLIPCFNVDVEQNIVGNTETYTVHFNAVCKSVKYYFVLVPNDYITFYNDKYLTNPGKEVEFKLGHYENYNLVYILGQYLPTIEYWDGIRWQDVPYNNPSTNLFKCSSIDFLMMRINTPTILGNKIGNYSMVVGQAIRNAKIRITVGDSVIDDVYSISGNILSLAFGSEGNVFHDLPDYFAKTIFEKMPKNIFGYAFKMVRGIGDYAMENMFSIPEHIAKGVSTDFIMLDNVTTIGLSGCKQLFYKASFSGFSMNNLTAIDESGCESMFEYGNGIQTDINLLNLTEVKDNGCKKMFYMADGSQTSDYIVQEREIEVAFPKLHYVWNNSFESIFEGCGKLIINLRLNGSYTITYIGNARNSNTFLKSFYHSGVKTANLIRIGLPQNSGNDFLKEMFENCNRLESIIVGATFIFESGHPHTTDWLKNTGTTYSSGSFECHLGCYRSIEDIGRSDSTVPENYWTIKLTEFHPI